MDYVLKTDKITKIYGKHTVVDHVSMHVKKGDIYGFIGKNGAGKTTFMRIVAGLATPAAGSMELFGSGDLEKRRQRQYCCCACYVTENKSTISKSSYYF